MSDEAQTAPAGDPAVRFWIWTSVVWGFVGVFYGMVQSLQFFPVPVTELIFRPLLEAGATFGRMRQAHVNVMTFALVGGLQTAAALYIIPRLARVPLCSDRLAIFAGVVFNVVMLLANLSLLFAWPTPQKGREWAELPLWLTPFFALWVITIGIVLGRTIVRRLDRQLYVSNWYLAATYLLWTPIVYTLGNAPVAGVAGAQLNWMYGHNIIGLWTTTAGVGMAYYFVPLVARRPMYSHTLSIIGFFTIAMTYIWTGNHHLMWGPIPYWAMSLAIIFSVLLIIPVWTVLFNFYGTFRGRWAEAWSLQDPSRGLTARYLIAGSMLYFFVCVQGPVQALRSVSEVTHFTFWVPGHSHFALFGTFALWGFAGLSWMLPRLTGKPFRWPRLMGAVFWVNLVGILVFSGAQTVAGLRQSFSWSRLESWTATLERLTSLMVWRLLGGVTLSTGIVLMLVWTAAMLRRGRPARGT